MSESHHLLQAVRVLLDAGDTGASAVLTAEEARAIMAWVRPSLLEVVGRELERRVGTPEPIAEQDRRDRRGEYRGHTQGR